MYTIYMHTYVCTHNLMSLSGVNWQSTSKIGGFRARNDHVKMTAAEIPGTNLCPLKHSTTPKIVEVRHFEGTIDGQVCPQQPQICCAQSSAVHRSKRDTTNPWTHDNSETWGSFGLKELCAPVIRRVLPCPASFWGPLG